MNFIGLKKRLDSIPTIASVLFLVLIPFHIAGSKTPVSFSGDTIMAEMQKVLNKEFDCFYPTSIDSACGGFFSDLNYKWELSGKQNKMIVTQARHIWSAANAALYYHKGNAFLDIARHGTEFLKNKMWDKEFGGFYELVTREGIQIADPRQAAKTAYGNAFAIYGLATYYRASGDTAALKLARETFYWLENHSYDLKYGGYFQLISREGSPYENGMERIPAKDQNSSIHIMESFTELYNVWSDSLLKDRLASLFRLIRDSLVDKKGYIKLFFKKNWTPISYADSSAEVRENNIYYDHISFGHDIEIAYLLLEALKALGMENDARTIAVAKKMVDHVLQYGMDEEHGGVYDGGYYLRGESKPAVILKTKEWWSQVEALNSLLIMAELYPDDERHYYKSFVRQWDYCKRYVIDPDYGGWYWDGIDTAPDMKYYPKSSIWKCNYHTSRALINCINRLKNGKIRVVK